MEGAIYTPPPPGTYVAPPPGGVVGRPPGGFVYPSWLPVIPGTIQIMPKVVEPPTTCPTDNQFAFLVNDYYGGLYDESISGGKDIVGKSLRDCEIKNCRLKNCTLTDCLLISCKVDEGEMRDVELRNTTVFKSKLHDVKAISDCKFGACTITEGDINGCAFNDCTIGSSEVKNCQAWKSKFSDCTVRNIKAYSGCKFTDCGGNVPEMPKDDEPAAPQPVPAYVGVLPSESDCPKQEICKPSLLTSYFGKCKDDVINDKLLSGKTIVDCEVRDCFIENSNLTDCLVINCKGNYGTWKDVELRGCLIFKGDINDVKAVDKCLFGECTIHEGDLQNCHYDTCTVTSSAVTNGIAWDTKFRDVTIKNVSTQGKCKFALCGGDVPKKDSDSDDDMAGVPTGGGGYTYQQPK